MDKYLIGEFWWIGSLSFALGIIEGTTVQRDATSKKIAVTIILLIKRSKIQKMKKDK